MAEDAPKSIDGPIKQSIPERSQGAGEASPDATHDVGVDGLQSSPNIGEARDVLPDDRRPSTRGQGDSELAATEADRRWIETVLGDLESRSPETRKALATALVGHPVTSAGHVSGLELDKRKSANDEHSICDQSADPSAPPVSGTTSQLKRSILPPLACPFGHSGAGRELIAARAVDQTGRSTILVPRREFDGAPP